MVRVRFRCPASNASPALKLSRSNGFFYDKMCSVLFWISSSPATHICRRFFRMPLRPTIVSVGFLRAMSSFPLPSLSFRTLRTNAATNVLRLVWIELMKRPGFAAFRALL